MIVQGVVKPAPGLDFASKPDVRLGVKLGHSAMSARCPVCPKADTTGRFYEYTPELDAARRSRCAQPGSDHCTACTPPALLRLVTTPRSACACPSACSSMWALAAASSTTLA